MESGSNKVLGTEKIDKLMRRYAVPCILSLLVGALYNIIDQLFIANAGYLGSNGNAAVTVVFPLMLFALAIASMIGDGCCAFVTLSLGKNEKKNARKSVGNSLSLLILAGIILCCMYLIFSSPLLKMFGGTVNDETFRNAKDYLFMISLGIPFFMFGHGMNPVIRADGSQGFAMISMLAGAVVNLILDPVFIFSFRWGMRGAAAATILGHVVTAVLVLWYLFRKMEIVRPGTGDCRLDQGIVRRTVILGTTSFLNQFSMVLFVLAVNNMIRWQGSSDPVFSQKEYAQIPLAVIGIEMKCAQIVMAVAAGMAAGCVPIAGYNIRAGKNRRVRDLFTKLLMAEACIGAIALLIFEIFPRQLMGIFGAGLESGHYTDFGIHVFRICLCMIIFACVNRGCFIFLQALGRAKESTTLSLIRELLFGMGAALLLPVFFGLDGVLFSMPFADLLTFVIAMILIKKTYKLLKAHA